MSKRALLTLALAGLTTLAIPAQEKKTDEKPAAGRTLKVKLNYTGAGTVDEKHRIVVFLFDSPDFMQGSGTPIASQTAASKTRTVTFEDAGASPVYVATAYCPAGDYDGQSGAPPSGSSIGLYAKTPGTPAPVQIEPGQTAEIDLAFDDTVKMP